jgi:hypothetical protein
MRLAIAVLFLICQAAGQSTVEPARTVQVRSYVRKDGTVVKAYTRAACGMSTAPRSTARRAFQAQWPCPSTGSPTGACPGYVVDHVLPLACSGIDAPENMQWQTIAEGKLKGSMGIGRLRPSYDSEGFRIFRRTFRPVTNCQIALAGRTARPARRESRPAANQQRNYYRSAITTRPHGSTSFRP